jgi:hypothetical protein
MTSTNNTTNTNEADRIRAEIMDMVQPGMWHTVATVHNRIAGNTHPVLMQLIREGQLAVAQVGYPRVFRPS